MGIVKGIDYKSFPKQGKWLYAGVNVCFKFDTSNIITGKIVRDDIEEPFITIIHLDDGRYVLATECQYQIIQLMTNIPDM